MENIVEIMKLNSSKNYLDEDGNKINILLNPGVSSSQIENFEVSNGVSLPVELKEILTFSDGINLFGVTILSLDEIQAFPLEKMIMFHNWGNGDFDVINEAGEVYFAAHSIEKLKFVSFSLSSWLKDVINEMELNCTLLHPEDYSNKNNEIGLYKFQ